MGVVGPAGSVSEEELDPCVPKAALWASRHAGAPERPTMGHAWANRRDTVAHPRQARVVARRRARQSEVQPTSLQVRLSPDYMAAWPLWRDGTEMKHPASLGMSQPLTAALKEWQEFFDQHFHHEGGWDASDSATWFDDYGYRLMHWIQAELPEADVEYDRWATKPLESTC